jgi:hypothetical protein
MDIGYHCRLIFIHRPLVSRNNIICAYNGVDAASGNVHGLRRAQSRPTWRQHGPVCMGTANLAIRRGRAALMVKYGSRRTGAGFSCAPMNRRHR